MQTETKPVILLAVLEYGELPELLRVAEVATVALEGRAIFLFVKHSYRRLAEDTAAVVAGGFLWMDAKGGIHSVAAPLKVEAIPQKNTGNFIQGPPVLPSRAIGRNLVGRCSAIAMLPFLSIFSIAAAIGQATRQVARDLANCARDMRRFRQRYRELHAMLATLHPSILIVGQDSLAGELSFLLHAAGQLGIPRLVTPFAMFSLQETADYARANPPHHVAASVVNRLVARVFPHWVLRHGSSNVLRLPGYRALALEMTGLVNGLPWSPLSEPVEAITASSEVAAEVLVALGIKRSMLHVIGSPMHDRLAGMLANRLALRARLCSEYSLDPKKPLLVCGWPVNMFAWLAGRPASYPDYSAVAEAWAKILAEMRSFHDVNVIVSVHPKTLDSEIIALKRANLPCRRTGADELIAAADIFTTLNGSSITAWAIACGVPVVLFDCFHTHYTDFLSLAGCLHAETEEEFSRALHDLCSNEANRTALAVHQQGDALHWGCLDGQAGARLANLLRDLTAGIK